MKKSLLVILLALSLLAAGCQTAGVGGGSATATTAAPAPGGAYPGPGAYPPAGQGQAAPGASLYPFYLDGTEVGWEQAVAMIMNGEVSQAMQSHDLKVTLTLKDGRTLVTTEPAIDEVMNVIQTCGDPCKDIQFATE